MADGLILEFEGFGVEKYEEVNGLLGIDMESGAGDWPAGMVAHTGGAKDGGWVVFEVWASQADQERSCKIGSGPPWPRLGSRDHRPAWSGSVAAHRNPGG
jgi:hypothetical protein